LADEKEKQVKLEELVPALAPFLVEVKEELHRRGEAINRIQGENSFIQSDNDRLRDKVHALEEAHLALVTRSKKLLQSDVYKRVEAHGGYVDLAARVLEAYIEELRKWDQSEHPLGIHYTKIADHFRDEQGNITVAHVNSIRRRLNELSMKHAPDRTCPGCRKCKFGARPHVIKCGGCAICKYEFPEPPLKWTEPAFYLPNTLRPEIAAQ
jgi:hypothetical protein